jgi:SNF2 family DNA or RNA helicase
LQNPSTLTGKAMFNLPSKKRIATSGTPAGGRPLKYWGVLHWLEPKEFKSKNRWAEQWLTISEKEHYVRGGRGEKAVTRDFNGDIRPGMEEEFYKAHSRFMIRRTKDEVAPEMPPKQQEDRWAEMTGAQAAQYRAMAEDAEVKISETEAISATSILAEYTRLKQFANALCTLGEPDRSGRVPVLPTTTSCKLPIVEELLEERGVFDNNLPDAKAIIFSQFSSMVDMVHDWLAAKGAPVSKITGAVRPQDRGGIIDDFQREDGGAKVICVTTTAGGTAITLDRADTVIFLDETWVPDDQEQAEDRAHRISRIHNVNVFYIRTKGTIEETIMKKVGKKADVNKIILDLHRTGFRATHGDAT